MNEKHKYKEDFDKVRKKSANVDDYLSYLQCVHKHYRVFTDFYWRKKRLKEKFALEMRRQRAMANVVNKMKSFVERDQIRSTGSEKTDMGTILFGDGAQGGKFMKLRNGRKGPVLEIQKKFSKVLNVAVCDEYHTSQCCIDCLRRVKTNVNCHYLVHCSHKDCPSRFEKNPRAKKSQKNGWHAVRNRDDKACSVIAAIFFARLWKIHQGNLTNL